MILIAFVGGLFSTTEQSTEFFENPITLLTWVDFWVGLGIVSWLVGNVWELVSPLNIAARALDRALAAATWQPLRYPERLGQWPAVALLLVWSWMELIWGPAKEPRTLALILLAYIVATLRRHGASSAPRRGSGTSSSSRSSRGRCRASRRSSCGRSSRRNGRRPSPCGAVGATAAVRRRPAPRSGAAGRRRSVRAHDACDRRVRRLVADRPLRDVPAVVLRPLVVPRTARRRAADACRCIAVVVVFVGAYLLVTGSQARLLAPTLIPIAAVYFTAHYFAYLLIAGEDTPAVLVDPFGHSWNPFGWGEYELWKGIAPAGARLVDPDPPHRLGARRRGLRRAPAGASGRPSREPRSSPRRRSSG